MPAQGAKRKDPIARSDRQDPIASDPIASDPIASRGVAATDGSIFLIQQRAP
jgi:hypothetical protein